MNFRVHGWFIGGGLTIVWTCLCTSFVGSAWAQPKAVVAPISSNDESLADRYFFEAKARAAEQNWEEAYQLLEKAWELKPSHDIAGNLGQVALKLGRYKKPNSVPKFRPYSNRRAGMSQLFAYMSYRSRVKCC